MQQVAAELQPVGDRVRPPAARGRRTTPTGRCAGSRPRSRPTSAATPRSPPRTPCTATAARPGTVRFVSRSGVLVAHTADDGTITLDFPAAPPTEVARPRGPGGGARRRAPRDLRHRRARRPADRLRRRGRRARAGARLRRRGAPGPARGHPRDHRHRARADPAAGYDFVSRFFAPADGIPEDPVTGSAHTALAPFWSERLGRDGLTGLQASARGGLVRTSLHGDRVHLTGHAVVVLDGTLTGADECGRRDSNPQGLRHRHLKPACLPISPRPLARNRRTRPAPDCMVRRHGRGRRQDRASQPQEGLEQGEQGRRHPAPAGLGGAGPHRHDRRLGRASGRQGAADRLHRRLSGDGLLRRALEPRRAPGRRRAGDHPAHLRRRRGARRGSSATRPASRTRRSTRACSGSSRCSSSRSRRCSSSSRCRPSRRSGTSRSSAATDSPSEPAPAAG